MALGLDTRGHLLVIVARSGALMQGVGEVELLALVEGVFELAVMVSVFGGGSLAAPGG